MPGKEFEKFHINDKFTFIMRNKGRKSLLISLYRSLSVERGGIGLFTKKVDKKQEKSQ
ncbi:MAG: hypothetical protein ACLQQ4_05855 [Bacteroidia bacterium]